MLPLLAEGGVHPDVGGYAGILGLIAGIGALAKTVWDTRRSNRVEDENRTLTEAWRNLDAVKVDLAASRKENQELREENRKMNDSLGAVREDYARAMERIDFLTSWLEEKGIRVPRRRPPGMTDSEAAHTPLPPDKGGKP
jgi:hypothetical protein